MKIMKKKWLLNNLKQFKYKIGYIILYNLFISLLGITSILITKKLINYASEGNFSGLNKFIIIFILITLIQVTSSPINSYISTIFKVNIFNDIQIKLYKKVIHKNSKHKYKFTNFDIINRLNSDVSMVVSFICDVIPNIISLTTTLMLSILLIVDINPIYLLIIVVFSVSTSLMSKIFTKKQKELYKRIQKNDSDKKTHMSESINNIDIVKTFELQDKNFEFIGNLQNISTDLNKKNSKIIGFSSFLFSFGSIVSYTIILSIAVYGLALKSINIAEFTVLLQLYRQIQAPISQLQSYIPIITNIMAAVDRIFEIDILDSEKVDINKKVEFRKNIKLDNISLEYENGSKVLKDLSLKICKGDIVGIIGDSGAGKSTFLKAILNIIDTSKGEIFIDDEILNASHRSLMSYVPQDDMLFSMSIKENLLYLDKDLNYSEIEMALKLTKANEFIEKLPNGIDTNVNLLSKGQRQRISLARAILKKSPILILDEITSALDIETEEYIINSIKNLDYKPTCIIVTHRKPILSICNKVYKIDQSSITSKVSA